MADLFLERGRIVALRGRHPDSAQVYEAAGRDLAAGLPMAVVVDGGSASAAEPPSCRIAAARWWSARRRTARATVQISLPLPNQGEIALTWSRVFPPSGVALQGRGVMPTVCVRGLRPADGDNTDPMWSTPGPAFWASANNDRRSCPAERRSGDADLTIARRVVEDRLLYARALERSPVVVEATNGRSLDRGTDAAIVPATPRAWRKRGETSWPNPTRF